MSTSADMQPAARSATRRRPSQRPPLSRERVLREALQLVDKEGLRALTMRALGNRLGVEAMSLYNHVPGKNGVRDGIRELLWEELAQALERGAGWKDSMRALARGIWQLAHEHPHAFPLLISGTTLTEPMLRTLATGLQTLEENVDRDRAASTLNAIAHYALGYSMMALAVSAAIPAAAGPEAELETIVRITRALPQDAPPELVRVARDCCRCDLNPQFEFGLEALLAGLDPDCDTHSA